MLAADLWFFCAKKFLKAQKGLHKLWVKLSKEMTGREREDEKQKQIFSKKVTFLHYNNKALK